MELICDGIMDFQRKGRYELKYRKAQKLRGYTTKVTRTFGIVDKQGNMLLITRSP